MRLPYWNKSGSINQSINLSLSLPPYGLGVGDGWHFEVRLGEVQFQFNYVCQRGMSVLLHFRRQALTYLLRRWCRTLILVVGCLIRKQHRLLQIKIHKLCMQFCYWYLVKISLCKIVRWPVFSTWLFSWQSYGNATCNCIVWLSLAPLSRQGNSRKWYWTLFAQAKKYLCTIRVKKIRW